MRWQILLWKGIDTGERSVTTDGNSGCSRVALEKWTNYTLQINLPCFSSRCMTTARQRRDITGERSAKSCEIEREGDEKRPGMGCELKGEQEGRMECARVRGLHCVSWQILVDNGKG